MRLNLHWIAIIICLGNCHNFVVQGIPRNFYPTILIMYRKFEDNDAPFPARNTLEENLARRGRDLHKKREVIYRQKEFLRIRLLSCRNRESGDVFSLLANQEPDVFRDVMILLRKSPHTIWQIQIDQMESPSTCILIRQFCPTPWFDTLSKNTFWK